MQIDISKPKRLMRPKQLVICDGCGRQFLKFACFIEKSEHHFCTDACYRRWQSDVNRWFWSHVEKSDSCWLWTGRVDRDGYGDCSESLGEQRAHRMSYVLHKGKIPDGLVICHTCESLYPVGDFTYRLCVRPDHIYAGTHTQNIADRDRTGRSAKGARAGNAKLTDGSVRQIRERYAAGGITQLALAREYGVNQTKISNVVTRTTWRHVL